MESVAIGVTSSPENRHQNRAIQNLQARPAASPRPPGEETGEGPGISSILQFQSPHPNLLLEGEGMDVGRFE